MVNVFSPRNKKTAPTGMADSRLARQKARFQISDC